MHFHIYKIALVCKHRIRVHCPRRLMLVLRRARVERFTAGSRFTMDVYWWRDIVSKQLAEVYSLILILDARESGFNRSLRTPALFERPKRGPGTYNRSVRTPAALDSQAWPGNVQPIRIVSPQNKMSSTKNKATPQQNSYVSCGVMRFFWWWRNRTLKLKD